MNPYLMPVIEFGPRVMKRIVANIEPHRLDEPTSPGRFSAREVIAHLADWEPIFLARMHQTISSPGSALAVYDEGQMALAHGYAESNITEQLGLFETHRRATAEFLKGLSQDDWAKSANHPERGVLTVRDQANIILGHDLYHIEQLSGLLGEKVAGTW